jgi:hypothetical protein
MTDTPSKASGAGQTIDLLKETDVGYWCEIFGVTPAQLREAVQAVGNNAVDVAGYLRGKGAPDRA